jgi:hypothetical protein
MMIQRIIMQKNIRLFIALFLGLLLLNGCSELKQTDKEAAMLIQDYFQRQQDGVINAAVQMYPVADQSHWLAFLQQAAKERGAVKAFVIESIEPNTVYSGKFYIATVRVTSSVAGGDDQTSLETVTALHKLSDDHIYLVSHMIKNIAGDR